MPTQINSNRFSARLPGLEPSPIREILSVIERPGMISFAGGLPAMETFPKMSLAAIPTQSMQYGASEGDPELREQIAANLNELGLKCSPSQVLVLSGSQQGIDLVAKLFIDPGTPVAVEAPTYLAALQVFRFFGASFTKLDPRLPDAGMKSERLPAFAYAIPTFQNPTGYCYDSNEREALAAACDRLNVPLFEDDPYRDLAFDRCERTPVCARLNKASWVYQGSFSKSLAPGLRLGYLAASTDLIPYLTRLKQAADLHSNRISQWYVLEQLRDQGRQRRIEDIVETYRRKRDFFASCLVENFSSLATWRTPPGGLFFWLELSRCLDTRKLLPDAIQRGVAFMPGESFYADKPEASGTLRLNFSHASEDQVEKGLRIMADLVSQYLAESSEIVASAKAYATTT